MLLTKGDIGKYYSIKTWIGMELIGQLMSIGKGTCKYRFMDVKESDTFDIYWDFSVIREIHESELLAKVL